MRSALVIGGGGGIGTAVSRKLASGGHVIVTYLRHAVRAEALASELTDASGHRCLAIPCDATSEVEVAAAFEKAADLGELGVVVFCAGGWGYPRLTDLTGETIRAEVELNLVSGLLVLAESARRVADGGRVVVVSSAAASLAPPRQAVYAAAKAGLETAARVAAKELGPRRITVNVVRPGATDTETLRAGTTERSLEALTGSNAMRRLGTPEDIAGAVAMLLHPDAGWVTGTVVDAQGGLV